MCSYQNDIHHLGDEESVLSKEFGTISIVISHGNTGDSQDDQMPTINEIIPEGLGEKAIK